jgi:metallo-beta-lactamase class B
MVVMVVVFIAGAVLFPMWRYTGRNIGQTFAEPSRIAGKLYYVCASDTAVLLITGPQGHVLVDGGYPGTPKSIMASIAKLGFDSADPEILCDHAQAHSAGSSP